MAALCMGLALCAAAASSPAGDAPGGDWLDSTPVRGWNHPFVLRRSGFTYACNECHRDLKTLPAATASRGEHRAIVLDHGQDMTCLSCHSAQDRTMLRNHDGSDLPAGQAIKLCATCHGTVYRDWKAGAHGRTNGYWDAARGTVVKLECIHCHDPHSPSFKAMAPMPPPVLSGPGVGRPEARHE